METTENDYRDMIASASEAIIAWGKACADVFENVSPIDAGDPLAVIVATWSAHIAQFHRERSLMLAQLVDRVMELDNTTYDPTHELGIEAVIQARYRAVGIRETIGAIGWSVPFLALERSKLNQAHSNAIAKSLGVPTL
jgi:hypothetical protein